MLLFERLVSVYAPFQCIGCGAEADRLLCETCCETLPRTPSRCYRCRSVSRGSEVCERCRKLTSLRHVYVACVYDGLAKEQLHAAKYERAKHGLHEIAAQMEALLRDTPAEAVLVPIPTATSRVRQRGYDQSVELTKHLSRSTKLSRAHLLVRLGQAHQVGSGRAARLRHLEGAFRLRRGVDIHGKHVVLVDDVVTSGATLETAAKLLKKAGAKQVDAVVFAQPD